MCGICGIAATDPREVPAGPETVQAMTAAMTHRGPDDDGHLIEPGVVLGMRRLSIIDVAGGAQPIANEDRSVWTVFNGEIYNFPELRRELAGRGHTLSTEGDTETIVHLYEEHGDDFARRLRGMFSIAVWDRRRRRLVLARDRMGVKPLYYVTGPFGLAFASEVKPLIAGGLVDPSLDPLGAELFLAWGYVPAPYTLFAGVHKLMPGSVLVWEDGAIRQQRAYWDPWSSPTEERGGWADDGERLLHLLRESVRARMISEVPIGVMLSGGLDSSLIATLMAEEAGEPIKTFSIGFVEDKEANELADARRVAQRLGTDHHELTASALEHAELLDEALWYMEEPVADLSYMGFLALSRLARESVTVALSGQGADELLGGYRKHQIAAAASLAERVPALAQLFTGAAGLAAPDSSLARALTAVGTRDPVQRMLAMSRVVSAQQRLQVLDPRFRTPDGERTIGDVLRPHLAPGEASALSETLHLDARVALVDNMFLYFDKMSMAASLEVRVPFMDVDVVSFCRGLPDSRKVWRLRRKELLRRASRGLLDDAIIDKKKRGFFHSALGTWLDLHRDTLIRDTLLDPVTAGRGQFHPPAVRALAQRAGRDGKKTDQQVFCLFLLERWQRLFVDGAGARPSPAARPLAMRS